MERATLFWLIKDIRASEIPFAQRTFKEKLRVIRLYFTIGVFGAVLLVFTRNISDKRNKVKETKNKFRFFKPTIYDNIFGGKRISWEARDKPLTDEEMSLFCDDKTFSEF